MAFDWDGSLGRMNHDPDEQVYLFDETVLNVANNYIPFDDKVINPKDPPWITKSSKDFYRNYRRKYRKFVKNGCPHEEKHQIYQLKDEYTKMVVNGNNKYMESLGNDLSNPQSSQKKYWSALKKL